MKIISWNVRSMNSVSKRAVLKGMVQSSKGECLFVQETKMEMIDDQIIRSISPWPSYQYVMCPSGASGGILVLWNAKFWQKLDEFVSILMKDVICDAEWVATSVYGPNNANDRGIFWAELNQVAGSWNHPWVVGGDFNVIRHLRKKEVARLVRLCVTLMIGSELRIFVICLCKELNSHGQICNNFL